MTVRRRILFAALAVGVVGTFAVIFLSAGPKDNTPKVSLTLSGHKKGAEQIVVINITNSETCPIAVDIFEIEVEGVGQRVPTRAKPRGAILQSGGWTNFWLEFRTDGIELTPPVRDRISCFAERRTRYNKLLERIHALPVIGSHVDGPPVYRITSQMFDQ